MATWDTEDEEDYIKYMPTRNEQIDSADESPLDDYIHLNECDDGFDFEYDDPYEHNPYRSGSQQETSNYSQYECESDLSEDHNNPEYQTLLATCENLKTELENLREINKNEDSFECNLSECESQFGEDPGGPSYDELFDTVQYLKTLLQAENGYQNHDEDLHEEPRYEDGFDFEHAYADDYDEDEYDYNQSECESQQSEDYETLLAIKESLEVQLENLRVTNSDFDTDKSDYNNFEYASERNEDSDGIEYDTLLTTYESLKIELERLQATNANKEWVTSIIPLERDSHSLIDLTENPEVLGGLTVPNNLIGSSNSPLEFANTLSEPSTTIQKDLVPLVHNQTELIDLNGSTESGVNTVDLTNLSETQAITNNQIFVNNKVLSLNPHPYLANRIPEYKPTVRDIPFPVVEILPTIQTSGQIDSGPSTFSDNSAKSIPILKRPTPQPSLSISCGSIVKEKASTSQDRENQNIDSNHALSCSPPPIIRNGANTSQTKHEEIFRKINMVSPQGVQSAQLSKNDRNISNLKISSSHNKKEPKTLKPEFVVEQIQHALEIVSNVLNENDSLLEASRNNLLAEEIETLFSNPDQELIAEVIAEKYSNESEKIAGILAFWPRNPRWIKTICVQLKTLRLKEEELAKQLNENGHVPLSVAYDLAAGINHGIQVIAIKGQESYEEPLTSTLNHHILYCSTVAGLTKSLLLRERCPICYLGIKIEEPLATNKPELKMFKIKVQETKKGKGDLEHYFNCLLTEQVVELALAFHLEESQAEADKNDQNLVVERRMDSFSSNPNQNTGPPVILQNRAVQLFPPKATIPIKPFPDPPPLDRRKETNSHSKNLESDLTVPLQNPNNSDENLAFPNETKVVNKQEIDIDLKSEDSVPLSSNTSLDVIRAEIKNNLNNAIPSTIEDQIRHGLNISCHIFDEEALTEASKINPLVAEVLKAESELEIDPKEKRIIDDGTVARKQPDPDADIGVRRRRRNLYGRAKKFAEQIQNDPKRIAGILASRPKEPKWVAAVCKELRRLGLKKDKLTEELIQKDGLNKSTATSLGQGLEEAVQIISKKAELDEKDSKEDEKDKITGLKENLRCSALRCSIPAKLAATLLTRDSCPICYFGITDTSSIARPNIRMYNTYNRKKEDGTLHAWFKDISTEKMLEVVVSRHEAECRNSNF